MLKRLNELNFVIGVFFVIVSLILLSGSLINKAHSGRINIYTGITFLLFGILMIIIKEKKNRE